MSLPKGHAIVKKNGTVLLEIDEKSDQCYKLNDIARMLGKVVSEEKKEHVPAYHDVHQKT